MNNVDRFKSAALENGHCKVDEYQSGSVVWFTQMTSDGGGEIRKRLCIDSLTDSVTVFWQTDAAKLNSKTFRTVSSLEFVYSAAGPHDAGRNVRHIGYQPKSDKLASPADVSGDIFKQADRYD